MVKKLLSAVVAVCLAFSLTACDVPYIDKVQSEYPVTIGHTAIHQPPEKAVVLNDSIADIMIACGYTDKIVAKGDNCTQPELSNIQQVGNAGQPNVDAIISAKPEIVFADDTISAEAYTAMTDKGITVLRMAAAADHNSLAAMYKKLCSVFDGNITGNEKGITIADDIIVNMSLIRESAPESKTATTACYIFDMNGSAVTGDMFASEILTSAGAINIGSEVTGGTLLIETLKAQNPNYIFCAEGLKAQIMSSDDFKTITAVKKSRVYEIPATEMTRQGNTIIKGVEDINAILFAALQTDVAQSVEADYGIAISEDMSYTTGDEDDNVLAIQKRLDSLGYMPIEPTGYFGASTATAVSEFQENNDLDSRDGIANYTTLKALFLSSAVERATAAR